MLPAGYRDTTQNFDPEVIGFRVSVGLGNNLWSDLRVAINVTAIPATDEGVTAFDK
jgi:hypothetical protein